MVEIVSYKSVIEEIKVDNIKPNKEVLWYIYDMPEIFLELSNETFLNVIVNNGFHANALCEALNVKELIVNIDGIEYKLTYTKPMIFETHKEAMENW